MTTDEKLSSERSWIYRSKNRARCARGRTVAVENTAARPDTRNEANDRRQPATLMG